jgi:hypothetical protein
MQIYVGEGPACRSPGHALVDEQSCIRYDSQGRYGEAEELHKRVLVVGDQNLGADHSDTFKSTSNLASVYGSQECYGEAEEQAGPS